MSTPSVQPCLPLSALTRRMPMNCEHWYSVCDSTLCSHSHSRCCSFGLQVLTLAARANVTHTLVEMLNEEAEAAWDKLAAQAGEAGAAPPAKPEPVAWPEEGEEAGAYERPGEQRVTDCACVCESAYQLTMSTTAPRHVTSPQRRRKRGRSWQTQSQRRRRWRQTLSDWRGMRRRTLDRRMSGGPCMSGASKQPSPSTQAHAHTHVCKQ